MDSQPGRDERKLFPHSNKNVMSSAMWSNFQLSAQQNPFITSLNSVLVHHMPRKIDHDLTDFKGVTPMVLYYFTTKKQWNITSDI